MLNFGGAYLTSPKDSGVFEKGLGDFLVIYEEKRRRKEAEET